jgi:hypothetical protein
MGVARVPMDTDKDTSPGGPSADQPAAKAPAKRATDTVSIKRILDTLKLLIEPGAVVELRALDVSTPDYKRPHTVSGFFDDPERLAKAATSLTGARGIYLTLNPVNPALLARAANRLRPISERYASTSDGDVVRRRWLPIDCDPVRPSGICATDAEHETGLRQAQEIRDVLSCEGWPAPIMADAGNSGHLLYAIDLPNDDASRELVKGCLEALAFRYDDGQVIIDKRVFNAARIWRLYGTVNCKGDNTSERPHRLARILDGTDRRIPVSRELLEALARSAPRPEPLQARQVRNGQPFDIDRWIGERGLDVIGPHSWDKGRRWIFPVCPWNADHCNRSAYLVEFATGAVAAGCHHNGCHGKDWHSLRDLIEPGWRERGQQKGAGDVSQDGHDESGAEEVREPPRKSQATMLVEMALASNIELFHTPGADAEGCVVIPADGHQEVWPLKVKRVRRWLEQRFYAEHEKVPGGHAVQDAVNTLTGMALHKGKEYPVYTRLAEHDGALYLDLANEQWEAIEIDSKGWRLVPEPPVKFRRARGMLPLPTPVKGGSVDDLRTLLNLAEDVDWTLAKAWLVQALRPSGPYPVLVMHGEQGSAKSTTSRMVRALIDPSTAPLRSEPCDGRDLMIAANNGWLIALDNLSHIQPWLSDAICRLATGGGFSTRELYSDAEEVIFDAKRPVLINGIEELATRGDLLDRCIILYLPAIPEDQRRPEADLWRDFDAKRPRILAALLDGVSEALRNVDDLKIDRLPRMADFAVWASAAAPKLGYDSKTFLEAYTGNRGDANELTLEASIVTPFVKDLAEKEWSGTATEMLKHFTEKADEATKRQKGWPSNGRALSNALRRIAPNLRAVGIEITFGRDTEDRKRKRTITLKNIPGDKLCNFASAASATSASKENQGLKADDPADIKSRAEARRTQTESHVCVGNIGHVDAADAADAKNLLWSGRMNLGDEEEL